VYRFRVQFRFEEGRDLTAFGQLPRSVVAWGDGSSVLKQLGESDQYVLTSGTFAESEAARVAGDRAVYAILWACLTNQAGVSFSASQAVFTQAGLERGLDFFGGMVQARVLAGGRGVTVYEDSAEPVKFIESRTSSTLQTPADQFFQLVEEGLDFSAEFDTRVVSALTLYSLARTEADPKTRFLLLVMCIESMAKRRRIAESVQEHIGNLVKLTQESSLSDQERANLAARLSDLERESISSSCRRFLEDTLETPELYAGMDCGDFFGQCYSLRSTYVHEGIWKEPEKLHGIAVSELDRLVRTSIAAYVRHRGSGGRSA